MLSTGKTTRFIDNAIQNFFDKGFAYIYKHRTSSKSKNDEVLNRFTNRLFNEHRLIINNDYTTEYASFSGIWCYKVIKKHYAKNRDSGKQGHSS